MRYVSIMDEILQNNNYKLYYNTVYYHEILQNNNYKLYYNTVYYHKIFTIVELSNLSYVKIK